MRENVFVFKKCTQKYQIRTSSFVSAVSISEHVSYEQQMEGDNQQTSTLSQSRVPIAVFY